jgi:hypothetical protein
MTPLSADAAKLLAAGRIAHVTVATGRGPFTTPVLYGVGGARLWFLVRRDTLKARALRADPRVALVVRDGDAAVVVRGRTTLLESARPWRWLTAPLEAAAAPFGALSWTARNPRQVLGFLRDAVPTPSGLAPQQFIAVAVEPEASYVVAAGADDRPAPVAVGPLPGPELPDGLGAVAHRAGPAVLSTLTDDGPAAVPAHWDAREARLRPLAALPLSVGARVAVTLVDTLRARPSEQRGVMLRGAVTGPGAVEVSVERATYWAGFGTGTVDVTGQPARSQATRLGTSTDEPAGSSGRSSTEAATAVR